MSKKIIALSLAIIFALSLASPALASGDDVSGGGQSNSFWYWLGLAWPVHEGCTSSTSGEHNFCYIVGVSEDIFDYRCSECGDSYIDWIKMRYFSPDGNAPDVSVPYLVKSHVDADGRIWYLICGMPLPTLTNAPGNSNYVFRQENDTDLDGGTYRLLWDYSYGGFGNSYIRGCGFEFGSAPRPYWYSIQAPILGHYDIVLSYTFDSHREDTLGDWFPQVTSNKASWGQFTSATGYKSISIGTRDVGGLIYNQTFGARVDSGTYGEAQLKFFFRCDPVGSLYTDTPVNAGDIYDVDGNAISIIDTDNNMIYDNSSQSWILYDSIFYDYSSREYTIVAGGDEYVVQYAGDRVIYSEYYTENGDIYVNNYNYYYDTNGGAGGGSGDGSWITDLGTLFGSGLGDLFTALWSTIVDVITQVINFVFSLIQNIWSVIEDALSTFFIDIVDFFEFFNSDTYDISGGVMPF